MSRHFDCMNYVNLDCEKGMCALTKAIVPIDGSGSEGCPKFELAPKCGNCLKFQNPDDHGIGTCSGFEKEDWAFASCGAFSCEKYEKRLQAM